jgi:DNA-binding response OmpR family regulator
MKAIASVLELFVPTQIDRAGLLARSQTSTFLLTSHNLKLPRTEFLIVSRLAQSANRIVTADELCACAWGKAKPLNSESLHVHIYRLRNKLVPFGVNIETMVNVGYKLIVNR